MKKKNLRFTVMKTNRLHIVSGILTTLLFIACSKGGVPDENPHVENNSDYTAPVVEIFTPTADQVFTGGSAISVTGKITDEAGLYRGSIRITNDANGAVIKEQQYEIHGVLLYNFSVTHTTAVTMASDYTVTVSFEDHGLNTTSRSVKVKVNP